MATIALPPYPALREGAHAATLAVRETGPVGAPKPRLFDRVRQAIPARHYSFYGAGPRLLECCRLRIKDVDFGMSQLLIPDGKGNKDRVTTLPAAVQTDLAGHIQPGREQHQADLRHGAGWVELPWALARKYPNAGLAWGCRQASHPPHLPALVRHPPA